MSKFDENKESNVEKLEYAFSRGANISAACFFAGISRQTYYNYCEEIEGLQERFDNLRQNPVMKALETVYENLQDKEIAKWYLERRNKDFKPKSDLTSDNKALPTPILNNVISSNNSNQENTEPQEKD